jgi:OOP family OmpA-OmpF porin
MMSMSIKMSYIRMGGVGAICALIGASSTASRAAEPAMGWYISGVAGLNFMQQEPIKSVGNVTTNNTNNNNLNVQFDVGGVGVLGGGYAFGNGFRTEFQFNYRYNGIKSASGPRGNTIAFNNNNNGGSEQKFGPMPTLYYDFYTLSPSYVPYVGIGVGYQIVREKLNVGGFSTNTTRGALGTQAIFGVAFPIESVPGLSVTTDYRFLAIVGNREYNRITLGNSYNHAITLGVRYAFGAGTVH